MTTLVIDGQALVRTLDKPHKLMAGTFGDFSKLFNASIFQTGHHFSYIDVVLDIYNQASIKQGARSKRQRSKPIRRIIEHADVPIPHEWNSFLSGPKNITAPENKCVVTADGLLKVDDVLCNHADLDITILKVIKKKLTPE